MKHLQLFLLLILTTSLFAHGQSNTIILDQNTDNFLIGNHLDILIDSLNQKIEDVVDSRNFKQNNSSVPNFGVTPLPCWARFKIKNYSSNKHFLINVEYPMLSNVSLFISNKNKQFHEITYSQDNGQQSKKYIYPSYIFDLDIAPDETVTVYIKASSTSQLMLPISIYKVNSLWSKISIEYMLSGLYAGIMLIMFFYNLFLFISIRDKIYLIYIAYTFFMGVTHLGVQGFNGSLFLTVFNGTQDIILITSASLAGIFATLFTIEFLQTKKTVSRYLHYSLIGIISIYGMSILIILIGAIQLGFIVMQMTTTIMTLLIIIVSYTLTFKSYQPAKYFSFAWSILLLCAIIFLLKDYDILPYNIYTKYSMQLGSAFEVALLSFALASKINTLKKDKEASQKRAIDVMKENEILVTQQNIVLEQRVQERTKELHESNDNLNNALDDLKNTQEKLIESEKMASLGQLTAGIAHEINNPINFVKSNVRPLKRDISYLYELIDKYEGINSLNEFENQLKEIEKYKEEIESDILKEEIESLISGIEEGATRTANIVEGLKAFSRSGNSSKQKYNIIDGIESCLTILNYKITSHNIQIEKKYTSPIFIDCLPDRINQVFMNIIDNSIDALAEIKDKKELIISVFENNENIEINIEDNGIGMNDETKKKLFDPFYTSKDIGKGIGLGLSITYGVIKNHNGQINVHSEKEKGSKFTIILPIKK